MKKSQDFRFLEKQIIITEWMIRKIQRLGGGVRGTQSKEKGSITLRSFHFRSFFPPLGPVGIEQQMMAGSPALLLILTLVVV